MPQLVFCKVSGRYRDHERFGYRSGLALTSLRSLQLPDADLAGLFLKNITAPHLEEFSLPNYCKPKDIASFLRRSACQCSLRSFSVRFSTNSYNLTVLDIRFIILLKLMPSLNTLSLISTGITGKDSDELTFDFDDDDEHDPGNILQLVAKVLFSQRTSLQQGFLPNLKTLEYTGKLHLRPFRMARNYCDLYPLPSTDNAAHCPFHLLKLEIHPVTRIPENMISYISSLVERGVTVKVLSDSKDILQSSIDYYRCRKEFLCQDWADNFDSSIFS
jgi:hypothetical protein